jgi:hypothetical protein
MQSTRRKPFQIGGSKGVTLPQGMTIGGDVTMAASSRLLLMDTTGETPEDKLLQFFIDYVEPAFQSWNQSPKQAINPAGRIPCYAAREAAGCHCGKTIGARGSSQPPTGRAAGILFSLRPTHCLDP